MPLAGKPRVEIAFAKTWSSLIVPNGVTLDGISASLRTEDAAVFDIVGDIEIRACATPNDWTPTAAGTFYSKWQGTSDRRSVDFYLSSNGKLGLSHSTDGTSGTVVTTASSVATGFTDGTTNWVAATLDVSSGDTKFYTYAGGHKPPAALTDWTQLGTTVSGSATSIHSGAAAPLVGAIQSGGGDGGAFLGVIHEVEVWNGFKADGGTLIANPRPSDVTQWAVGAVASTTGTDVQGNVWTLMNAATISGSWSDVTTDVLSVSYRRGRLYESDDFEAGSADIRLDNSARAYEPKFSGGANYPNVLPWTPIRVRVEYGGYSEIVWQGFVEAWDLSYPDAAKYAVASLKCGDAFRLFNRLNIRTYETEVAEDTPIAWWKLQETSGTTATDSGSLAVNGTYQGGTVPTLAQSGPSAGLYAVDFDDANTQEVDVGSLTGSSSAADFTVEFWLNADSTDSTATQAVLQIDTAGSDMLGVFYQRDLSPVRIGLQVPIAGSSWLGYQAWDLTVTEDAWHHVAFAVDYSEKTAVPYVNGVAGNTLQLTAWDQSRTGGTMNVKIAEGASMTNFDGLISEVAIYNSVLPAGRIKAHATAAAYSFVAQTYDTRISNILTAVGWNGGTDLRAGNSTLTALTTTDSTVLAAIKRAAASENGDVYVGRDGRVIGRDRTARGELQLASNFTFQKNFQDTIVSMDDTLIFNQVRVVTAADETLLAVDSASETSYGKRERRINNADLSVSDASDLAAAVLAKYKSPELRVERIEYNPEQSPSTLWPQLRDRDLGDLIVFTGEPPPKTGSAITANLFIENILVRMTPDAVRVVLQCSPASRQAFWVLNSPVFGQLNETTVVGY